MKPVQVNLIPGVTLAIPNEYALFDMNIASRGMCRCLLCGREVASNGGGPVTHAKLHLRRGELEEVRVDGLIWQTEGPEVGSAWKDSHVGYRTPGAGGFYVVKLMHAKDDSHLPYYRGEIPQWETLYATREECERNGARFIRKSAAAIRELPVSDPILPSMRDTPDIKHRIERAAQKKFARTKREVFFEHGHWWLRVTRTGSWKLYSAVGPIPKITTYDVVDASGPGSFDGFSFEEVG